MGQTAAGAVFPDAVAELVAKIPHRLNRAQSQAIKVAQVLDTTAQRHAAFEVKQELYRSRLRFFRQIAARLDHLNHAFGARRLFEKLVNLFERGFAAEGDWVPQQGILLPVAQAGQRLQVVHVEDEPEALFAELLGLGLHPGTELRLLQVSPERMQLEIAGERRQVSALAAANVTVLELPPAEVPGGFRLSTLPVGQTARVIALLPACHGPERRRLQDLGLLPGTRVRAEFASPAGNPVAYRIRGALIALRHEQAELIQVERAPA